jgi:hypothetical protein
VAIDEVDNQFQFETQAKKWGAVALPAQATTGNRSIMVLIFIFNLRY